MGSDLWERLGSVFAAGGTALLVTLVVGIALVPLFRRVQFVSRESKEGVAQGRTDVVPMGGGFILLLGVTIMISLLTAVGQIRRGYAACFLIGFWGFALLGFLDDRSKCLVRGYSDKVKVLLQVSVTLAFAVSFYLYFRTYVSAWELDYLTLPFLGKVPLGLALVPFVMVFLFGVSNAVNIADGFNGLAGGTGAVVALAYAVVTFLIGASELSSRGETEIAIRMFALSRMSAIIAGALIAYLYFNFCRGSIYFGDTGSMALGAALAFLAVFSRTELLLCVIGGVFFTEAASVFVQRMSVALTQLLTDPLARQAGEPFRPFIIAPLHHHFEHLMLRELEGTGRDQAELRPLVRRRITYASWALAGGFAVLGMVAEYGHYLSMYSFYDWACVAGALGWLAILGWGMFTRFLYDCYFVGPDLDGGQYLTLYRGIPWRCCGRRLFHVYERTDVPLARLGYLERRTGLFHLFFSRVDARVAFGLLHYQVAERAVGEQREAHLQRALRFWEKVPVNRFLAAQRHEVLEFMAEAYRQGGRYADAVRALETLYRDSQRAELVHRIEGVQAEALGAAEEAYGAWSAGQDGAATRESALRAHQELLDLLRIRYERARRVRLSLETRADAPPEERIALDNQIALLQEALTVAAQRCDRLQPEAGEG
ncbi:MAG: hypothetical protein HUU35_01210 [Armatimonadetes bacterium]|nr:hypothetical protein [Armatimonadota bacterium]